MIKEVLSMIYAVELVGVKSGASDPEQIREEFASEIAARIRIQKLARRGTQADQFVAFKLCLNNATERPWSNPIVYIDSMKKTIPETLQQHKPKKRESATFSIHFVRVCGEVVERCQTNLESDLLATEIHLSMEKENDANPHVDAFAIAVVQNHNQLWLYHVHYEGLKLLRKRLPNEGLGGYSWDELKQAKKWLFR